MANRFRIPSVTYDIGDLCGEPQSGSQTESLNRERTNIEGSNQVVLYKAPRFGVSYLIRYTCRLSRFTLPNFLLFRGLSSLEDLPLQPIILQALSIEAELATPIELLTE